MLFVHLLLSPLVFSRETVEAFEYPKTLLLVAAAIVLAVLAPWGAPSRALRRDPLRLGILLFVLSAGLSTAASRSPWVSLHGASESYFGLLTVLAYAALFFATRALCHSADDARRLMLAPVMAAGVAASYAVVQIAGVDPVLYGRTAALAGFVRPFATMGHPNFLSAFLAAALPMTAVALVRALEHGQRVLAAVLALVAALAGVAVAVAVSRGAWLALGVAALIVLVGARRTGPRRLVAVVGGVGVIVAAALTAVALLAPGGGRVLSGLLQRVRHFGDSAGRQHIWQAAWGLFRDHPLVGTGLDTFQMAFAEQRTPAYWAIEWNASPTRAHNEALNLLATQGLAGGLAVAVFTLGVLLAVKRALAAADDRLLVVGLAAGVAAFYVQDLFSFTVAGCGTLVVTQVALLSRLAEGGARPAEDDGVGWLAAAVGTGTLLALAVFASNLQIDVLVDEPARLAGVAVVVLTAVGIAAVVFALERHGRPLPLAGERRARAGPGPVTRRGLLLRWAVAGVLLVALVLRPLAASRAAADGIRRTPHDAPTAVERLRRAVALEPYVELYWVKLGSAAHGAAQTARDPAERRRRLQEARAAYARAVRLVPANAYNHANLGRALADLATEREVPPAEAFAAFDRALALDPNNAYFYVDGASAALRLGEVARAHDYATRGAARYPRFAVPRALLGHAALVRGEALEAAEALRGAIDAEWHGVPGRAGAASNLAVALLQLGRAADAAAAARLAITLAPGSVEARYNLGKSLERLGRRAEAIEEYRRLPDFEPARAALRALGAS